MAPRAVSNLERAPWRKSGAPGLVVTVVVVLLRLVVVSLSSRRRVVIVAVVTAIVIVIVIVVVVAWSSLSLQRGVSLVIDMRPPSFVGADRLRTEVSFKVEGFGDTKLRYFAVPFPRARASEHRPLVPSERPHAPRARRTASGARGRGVGDATEAKAAPQRQSVLVTDCAFDGVGQGRAGVVRGRGPCASPFSVSSTGIGGDPLGAERSRQGLGPGSSSCACCGRSAKASVTRRKAEQYHAIRASPQPSSCGATDSLRSCTIVQTVIESRRGGISANI